MRTEIYGSVTIKETGGDFMEISHKINGNWKDNWSAHVKIDKTYHDSDVYSKIDGVWKCIHKHFIEANDISGFRMIYKLNRSDDQKHPLFDHLRFNPRLPVEIYPSSGADLIDHSIKGIAYRYLPRGSSGIQEYEEGILMYNGILYAILTTEEAIAVSYSTETKVNNDDGKLPGSSIDEHEGWVSNRMSRMSLTLTGYTQFTDAEGFVSGWNSFFDKNQHLSLPANQHYAPSRSFLPLEARATSFYELAQLGIARNLTKPDNNMTGSKGVLGQVITGIKLDGVMKPFSIEVYD